MDLTSTSPHKGNISFVWSFFPPLLCLCSAFQILVNAVASLCNQSLVPSMFPHVSQLLLIFSSGHSSPLARHVPFAHVVCLGLHGSSHDVHSFQEFLPHQGGSSNLIIQVLCNRIPGLTQSLLISKKKQYVRFLPSPFACPVCITHPMLKLCDSWFTVSNVRKRPPQNNLEGTFETHVTLITLLLRVTCHLRAKAKFDFR